MSCPPRAVLAFLLAVLWPVVGDTYNSYPCGSGGAEIWANRQTDILQIDRNGFPAGSSRLNQLLEAINRWEGVPGSDLNIRYNTDHANADQLVYLSDLTSEIAWISDESMTEITGDSDLAVAFGFADLSCHIVAFDVLFNADRNFDYGLPQPPTTSNLRSEYNEYPFLNTVLHELGHMSLDHTANYDIMTTNVREGGCPDPGNHPERVGPDSREGMRALYPASGSETDLAVTSCYVKNLGGVDRELAFFDKVVRQDVCPGDSITVSRTLLNYGNSDQTVDVAYYFSDDLTISNHDLLAMTQSTPIPAESSRSDEVDLTIPAVPLSQYGKWLYVGAIVDPAQSLGEAITSNNRVLLRAKVKLAGATNCLATTKKDDDVKKEVVTKRAPHFFAAADFAARSTFVAVGRIHEIRYQKVGDEGPVYSSIRFYPEQIFKEQNLQGRERGIVVIRQYGGIDRERGYRFWMEGVPQLETGKRYLIFLGKNLFSLNPFVKGASGVWRIVSDPKIGYEYVISYGGEPIVGYQEGGFLTGPGQPLPFAQVVAALKGVAERSPPVKSYDERQPQSSISTVMEREAPLP